MRDFLRLTPRHDDPTILTASAAAYLRSQEFRDRVALIQDDPYVMAKLTIAVLKHIALDPMRGKTMGEIVTFAGQIPDVYKLTPDSPDIWFCLHFDRFTNFIGNFTLPRNAPETTALLEAIQENLSSRMFKAAALRRRLENKNQVRFARFERKASAARVQAYGGPGYQRLVQLNSYPDSTAAKQKRQAIDEEAQQAYEGCFKPLKNRLEQRLHKVGQAAHDTLFEGGYTDVLTAFAVTYLVPRESGAVHAQSM